MHDTYTFMIANQKSYKCLHDEPFNTSDTYIRNYQNNSPQVLDIDEYPIDDYHLKRRDYMRKWREKNEII